MTPGAPVIMVGLDAAELDLVDRLAGEGLMPNLARLRAAGRQGVLRPSPPAFLSMVWPSLVNGVPVTEHGWYSGKVWSPDRMRLEHVGRGWLPQRPFWDRIAAAGGRVAVVDVPFAPVPEGGGFPGVFLNGWQCHDDAGRGCSPPGLRRELRARFGRPALGPELFGPQTPAGLARLAREMAASARQAGEAAAWLLGRERFDLFLLVLGATHRGGHYLWDLSQVERQGVGPDERRGLEGALRRIHAAADEALGRVLAAAPPGARVLAFALHGMAPNDGWADRFPALVDLVRGGGAAPEGGLLHRAKKRLPWSVVREVTARLPPAVNHRLVPLWSARMHDWARTGWFGLPVDVNGYLRVNLRGREAGGIVEPGAGYERVCEELTAAFLALETIDGGERVVAAVDRADRLAPPGSPALRYLPDLIVRWSGGVRSVEVEGVRLPGRGEVRWGRGAPLPSGRSGNHVGRGWFAAAGPGVAPGRSGEPYDVCALPSTVLRWLGLEPAPGAAPPIDGLVEAPAAAAAPASTPS